MVNPIILKYDLKMKTEGRVQANLNMLLNTILKDENDWGVMWIVFFRDNLPCDFKDFVGGAVCKGKATIKRDSPHDDAQPTQKPPPRQDKEKKEPKAPTPPQENLEPVFDTIEV